MARKLTKLTPKTVITRNRDWTEPFLLGLAASGNVSIACSEAVISRETAYERRHEDPKFAAKWKEALNEAADLLEHEARRRAAEGVDEPVIHQGELCGSWVDCEGNPSKADVPGATFIPLTVKKYSDTLLIFLLKGVRPKKFRDNLNVKHTGSVAHVHTVKRAMKKLTNNPEAYALAKRLHERLSGTNDN